MVIINTAYLDPSVITIAFSAIAGVAVTIGAAVAVYYHRIKKKVNDKLGIDENAKKEVEEDMISCIFNTNLSKEARITSFYNKINIHVQSYVTYVINKSL